MKKRKAAKKKPAALNKANNNARRVAGKPPDGRTKAGRTWKAAAAEKARRARNREADKAAAAAAVIGSWVDLKDPNRLTAEQREKLWEENEKVAEKALNLQHEGQGVYKVDPSQSYLITDAVGGPTGKATVAYWRVGV